MNNKNKNLIIIILSIVVIILAIGMGITGFIKSLDMEKIFEEVKPMLEPFINEFLPKDIKSKHK